MFINAKSLYKALKELKPKSYSKYMPVINHVHFNVLPDETLILTITDLDDVKRVTRPCVINYGENFSVCVPMIIKSLKYSEKQKKTITAYHYPFIDLIEIFTEFDEIINITYDHKKVELIIKCGNSISRIKCIDAREFPSASWIEKKLNNEDVESSQLWDDEKKTED